jgi:hypothetical protein
MKYTLQSRISGKTGFNLITPEMKNILIVFFIAFLNGNLSKAQWIKINAIPSQDIIALSASGDTIFAATDSNLLYKSIDGGTNWDPIIVSNGPVVIITLKLIDDTIYVGTNSHGIFYSADNGISWVKKGSNLLAVTGIEKKGNNLYACTLGSGVLIYSQSVGDWIPFNNSLPSYSVNVYCMLSTSSSLFIAAGANGTFYRYDFNANAWNEEYYNGHLSPGLLIQKLINNSDTLFAVNGSRIIRSDDNGLTWTNDKVGSHNGYSRNIYSGIINHYTITNVLNGGTWIQQRSKLSAAGTSWTSNEEFLSSGYSYDFLELGNKFFLAKADGLYVRELLTEVDDSMHDKWIVKIFPNPSSNSAINISSDHQINELIILSNLRQTLYTEKVDRNQFTVRPNLSRGTYYISLQLSGDQNIVRKIIIE